MHTDSHSFHRIFLCSLILSLSISGCGIEDNQLASEKVGDELYDEPFRPQYHFTPERNWMNDPNGLVYADGEYHLFYQYNPEGIRWGHMSWGHAVSPDLVFWKHLPVALRETEEGMVFSGSAVLDSLNTSGFGSRTEPPIVAIFTLASEDNQSQGIAYSLDRGRSFTRYRGNPVIDKGLKDFRDPKVFWYAPSGHWVMVVALATDLKVQFYSSKDLRSWELLGDFGPAGVEKKPNWECPDLFQLLVEGEPTDRWVLKVDLGSGSVAGGSGGEYFVGEFDGRRFVPDYGNTSQWIDYGPDFYASQTWSGSPENGQNWIGWMNNWMYAQDIPTEPWRSAQSIPRVVKLRRIDEQIQLVQQPAPELEKLRGEMWEISTSDSLELEEQLQRISGETLEILAEIEPGTSHQFALALRKGTEEETLVGYDSDQEQLFLDRTNSGVASFHESFARRFSAPLKIRDGKIQLHIFVDRSSVEVFGGDGEIVLTAQVFPKLESQAIAFTSSGGQTGKVSMRIWKLGSIWQ